MAEQQMGCTHPSLGCSSLRDDGSPARWGCVICGIEFVPKPLAQRQWVGLTPEEIRQIGISLPIEHRFHSRAFARAIEAKLKEKNT